MKLRALDLSDAAEIARLNTQLGYDSGIDETLSRVARVVELKGHYLLGAQTGCGLAGFVHFFERPSIDKGRDMVVQALVTDAARRRSGIGRFPMQAVEATARSNGILAIALSSRID